MSNVFFPVTDGQGRTLQLKASTTRSAQFQTQVQRALGGNEFRVARWTSPRWKWAISIDGLPDDAMNSALETITAFFMARMGSFDSFLWVAPEDADAIAHFQSGGWNRLTGVQIGVGDGAQRVFQLVRPWGGGTWPYPVSEPVQWLDTRNNALVVRDNASVVSGVTVQTSGGIVMVTLPTAPASGHAVTADFDIAYRVRFLTDSMDVQWLAWQLWKGFAVEIEQVFE